MNLEIREFNTLKKTNYKTNKEVLKKSSSSSKIGTLAVWNDSRNDVGIINRQIDILSGIQKFEALSKDYYSLDTRQDKRVDLLLEIEKLALQTEALRLLVFSLYIQIAQKDKSNACKYTAMELASALASNSFGTFPEIEVLQLYCLLASKVSSERDWNRRFGIFLLIEQCTASYPDILGQMAFCFLRGRAFIDNDLVCRKEAEKIALTLCKKSFQSTHLTEGDGVKIENSKESVGIYILESLKNKDMSKLFFGLNKLIVMREQELIICPTDLLRSIGKFITNGENILFAKMDRPVSFGSLSIIYLAKLYCCALVEKKDAFQYLEAIRYFALKFPEAKYDAMACLLDVAKCGKNSAIKKLAMSEAKLLYYKHPEALEGQDIDIFIHALIDKGFTMQVLNGFWIDLIYYVEEYSYS